MFDQSQIQDMLDAAKPAVIEQLKRDLTSQIGYDVREQAGKIVKETVATWVQENIVPLVVEQLIASKEGLAAIATKLGPAMCDAMVAEMTKATIANLSTSYKRKQVFDALLG